MMRITQRAVVQGSLQGLNGNLAAVNKLQQRLTSGTTISKPSDSPTGTNTSMLTRQAVTANGQYSRNITDGTTFLQATDSALQDMLTQIRRVRDLTVQALNNGGNSAQSLGGVSPVVEGLDGEVPDPADLGEHVLERRVGGLEEGRAIGDVAAVLAVGRDRLPREHRRVRARRGVRRFADRRPRRQPLLELVDRRQVAVQPLKAALDDGALRDPHHLL